MTEKDQGVYRCEAVNSAGLKDEEEVEVRFGCTTPSNIKIFGARDNGLYELDSMLLLQCNATANPTPSYVWTKNGRIIRRSRELR